MHMFDTDWLPCVDFIAFEDHTVGSSTSYPVLEVLIRANDFPIETAGVEHVHQISKNNILIILIISHLRFVYLCRIKIKLINMSWHHLRSNYTEPSSDYFLYSGVWETVGS